MASLYYFNLVFLAMNFLLTCEMIKSESPLTCRDLMFISIEIFMPRIRDSYSVLFVQLNSILYKKRVVSLSVDLKAILAPEPTLECAP
jgi:hypothetical protein